MVVVITLGDEDCNYHYGAFEADFFLVRYCDATMVVARSSEFLNLNFGNEVSVPDLTNLQKPNSVCASKPPIHGRAKFLIQQELVSFYCRRRFYLHDDVHGEEVVPVVRVDPMEVYDNSSVTVPQIQHQGLLSLSSVRDLRYLQLNTPLP
jgi:hypothetical protein